MPVPRSTLGPGGPSVSALSLGSWHTWDRMDFADAVTLVRSAVDAGINLFDLGHYNVGPHVEHSYTDVLFGRIIQAAEVARRDYLLSVKLWLWNYPEQSLADQLEHCLFRIGAERADLVILGDFVGSVDFPRLVTEVAELIERGRCDHWGFNNWAAADVREVHAFATAEGLPTPRLAQLKYNLCRRSVPEGEPYREIFDRLGVRLQASDVFEGGLLAGNLSPERRIGADTGGIRDTIIETAPRLAAVAEDLDATPAQLAIAFCLTHPATATVLFGASSLRQLTENIGALDLLDRAGDVIRDRVAPFWLDRDIVSPAAAWGTEAPH